ncbi:MAG: M20 family peptidase, partial [Rhodospirillales bacterium]|nr:M20 family peptidase [Rhodospirillales bacterium]
MTDREQLLAWIEDEQDAMVAFYQDFVRAKSPNPPGDTLAAAGHITQFLTQHDVPHRIVDPNPIMPNVIGTFEGGAPG